MHTGRGLGARTPNNARRHHLQSRGAARDVHNRDNGHACMHVICVLYYYGVRTIPDGRKLWRESPLCMIMIIRRKSEPRVNQSAGAGDRGDGL